jgi:lipid-A-disaccharide synthase
MCHDLRQKGSSAAMRLLISAGEASGENYGAQLMAALRRRDPGMEFFGVGGERMRGAGCNTVVDASDVAVVGLAEVVTHLPFIYANFRKVVRTIEQRRPDAAVLIDFPDFNFRLAKQLHLRGVPVIYYVSPQLWAWRPGRIELVRRYVRKMLVIFPFEEQWYRERGVDAEYVGHPLADFTGPKLSREQLAARTGVDISKPWIALLPGSRRKEVAMNLPTLVEAAQQLGSNYEYLLPVASTLEHKWVANLIRRCKGEDTLATHAAGAAACGRGSRRIVLTCDSLSTLAHARAAVVASGTATVEAAVMNTPFVMVYRLSPLTWALGRRLVKVERFGMVNLIAGREVVPELVQSAFTADNVATEVGKIVADGASRESMLAGLAEVRARLRGDSASAATDRAACAVMEAIK